ncbi:ferritin-like domain-containing protein [Beggiatoa leptomitoformis]|uniref:DUF455 family protein n=1 Tax=Beggiatoa leptomitoformis TaxID=288004 RepID=A0A2N9YJN5_9GAMM|nr:ferritin-like domain-containing protein [Beggiatoa leptomitoformis]ALG69368.1 DUF455 family protein [Beggiatoa leptomitoformis]AUI70699.1 DUF455 family protein [Beggiatoa leptomitoformis]
MNHTLFSAAYNCLQATDPAVKIQLSRVTAEQWHTGQLSLLDDTPVLPITMAGHPPQLKLVHPRAVPKRKMQTPEGQIALLHAIAHIEFNAINLAWDAVYRFRQLPCAFYADWIKVAVEEAYHYELLSIELAKRGCCYGDLPAHSGLWDMAVETAEDVLVRMALVPRVLEARGLDASPYIIQRLQQAGSADLVTILQIILHDEIGHVAIGTRWFQHFCAERGLLPTETFLQLLKKHYTGKIHAPFNTVARLAAGFSTEELSLLEQL